MINLNSLLFTATIYITLMFGLAYVTEQGWISKKLIRHPLVYILSLGISISTWSFYTAVASAADRGYGYTAYYIGYAAAFLFAPIVLQPILHITRTYHLNSLADLFAFRFRSPWAGTLTTVVLLLCIIPLIIINNSIIVSSIETLSPEANAQIPAFILCFVMVVFTILFGARDISGRENHDAIVMAMAFESLVKFTVLMVIGFYAIYGVFGGFNNLEEWLMTQPAEVTRLDIPFQQNSTNLVILLFFTATITMPHMFHMTFRENSNPANLRTASWGIPLFLLIVSLPILPILWAASYLNSPVEVKFSALAIGMLSDAPMISLITFVGGLAAAFGVSVVLTMAMSGMCTNHLLLPLNKPEQGKSLYRWLLLRRQIFIAVILFGGFGCHFLITDNFDITDVSYVSFIACLQFLPGLLTLLYWPGGNSKGFISGLIVGVSVWLVLGLIPMFSDFSVTELSFSTPGIINWNLIASLSMLSNIVILVFISLLTKTNREEKAAAQLCISGHSGLPNRAKLLAKTPQEFINRLTAPLGQETAERETKQALQDLDLKLTETRQNKIYQLRGQLEANLSGLLGPTIANQTIDRFLPFAISSEKSAVNLSFIEQRLEAYPGNLTGVALDLDRLRRHHRQILLDLPIGVFSLDSNSTIAIWNNTMEKLTKISSESILGYYPSVLGQPWRKLLIDFIEDRTTLHIHKCSLSLDGKKQWLSLHKAYIDDDKTGSANKNQEGLIILVKDLTETELLEAELAHSERLASIGRLAAGVAHEIGNPITGIACLAQNIRDETRNDELRKMAEQIIVQTNRTSKIVHSLVSFSHSGSNRDLQEPTEIVSIWDCVNDAIQLLSLNHRSKDISFNNTCNKALNIHSDKQRLQQVFVNLLSNARDASHSGSSICVTDSIKNDQISISIIDQGEGIPEAIQEQIFEPFFTTKDPGKGTGLGLPLVYSIIEDLGGSIRIKSPVDKVSKTGTRVIVTFPCYDEPT